MEYNTNRNKLKIKEYGRNVQKLIEYAMTIEEDEERNKVVNAIITIMGQLNPHLRNVEDFRHKLWDHLYVISDYKIEADSPYPKPEREVLEAKPSHIGYPRKKIRFRHYGYNVETMVKKAIEETDEEKKMAYAECIGNYMKMAYNSRNADGIADETVISDLSLLSDEQLILTEDSNLRAHQVRSNNNHRNNNNRRSGKNNHRNSNNNNNKRRNNRNHR